jgi:hypothetical protein
MSAAERREGSSLFWMIAVFLVWASAFIMLYAALSVGCALGWERVLLGPVSAQRLVLIVIWIAHIFAILLVFSGYRRTLALRPIEPEQTHRFLTKSVWALTASALAATLWTGAPILQGSACV